MCVRACVCVQSEGGTRSPAVFGAMVSYIRDVLDVFGIDQLHSKVSTSKLLRDTDFLCEQYTCPDTGVLQLWP